MIDATLTDREIVVLEVVEALGGDVHILEVRELIRKPLRKCLYDLLSCLYNKGHLLRYAPGRYALTSEGSSVLVAARQAIAS